MIKFGFKEFVKRSVLWLLLLFFVWREKREGKGTSLILYNGKRTMGVCVLCHEGRWGPLVVILVFSLCNTPTLV
jgi:hypothetical protein